MGFHPSLSPRVLFDTPVEEVHEEDTYSEEWVWHLLTAWVWVLVFFVCLGISCTIAQIVYAVMYKSKVTDKRPDFKGADVLKGKDFKDGMFGCCDDINDCLNGCFCFACRCADTYETVGIMGYWVVILILTVAEILSNFGAQYLPHLLGSPASAQYCQWIPLLVYLPLAAFFATKRAEIRRSLGGDGGFFMDFLCLVCCAEC